MKDRPSKNVSSVPLLLFCLLLGFFFEISERSDITLNKLRQSREERQRSAAIHFWWHTVYTILPSKEEKKKSTFHYCFSYTLMKLKLLKLQVKKKRIQLKCAHIHLCCGPGVCAVSVLLKIGSGCVDLSCRHWPKRQIATPAVAPAPPLCGPPTSPWRNQAALLLCPCPSGARSGAPGRPTGAATCSHSVGCNKEAWPPVCRGRWRRQSLCSGHTGWCGSVSGWGPASCPRRHFGRPWIVTASGWRWGGIFQSSLCGHAGTLSVTR